MEAKDHRVEGVSSHLLGQELLLLLFTQQVLVARLLLLLLLCRFHSARSAHR